MVLSAAGRQRYNFSTTSINVWRPIAEGGVIDTIYFDFAKAFDSVPHRRLISKLESYGISGRVLNWIKNYLNERQQTVSVNGEKSDPVEVLSGVPQGTVLGPLLFVLYINDILDNTKSHGFMFADDTKLFRQVTSKADALVLQSDINLLDEWSKKWLLSFNKTNVSRSSTVDIILKLLSRKLSIVLWG